MLLRLKLRPYLVWHAEFENTKVVVFRNWIQDMLYPFNTAYKYEDIEYGSEHVAIDRTCITKKL